MATEGYLFTDKLFIGGGPTAARCWFGAPPKRGASASPPKAAPRRANAHGALRASWVCGARPYDAVTLPG